MRLSPRALHGGQFRHSADPARPETLGEHISADVLDAWFAPCPAAVAALEEHAGTLAKTSPPTYCEPLVEEICLARGLDARNVVIGPGSSSLLFLALRELIKANCRAVVQEPTYSEYTHLFESVIGCDLLRRRARPGGHHAELKALAECAEQGDIAVVALVNPANPGGGYLPVASVLQPLRSLSERTLLWVDEAYLEYVSGAESLEPFVARHPNLIVCKTMSKVYGLSGLRVAYLVADTAIAKRLRKITPPWAVSLPAQCAAIHALRNADYYQRVYGETRRLRGKLAESLRLLGAGEVIQSSANFVLWQCPHPRLLVQRAQERGLYMRVFTFEGEPYLRVAVKDATTNDRMISIIEGCLNELQSPATVLPPPAWPTAGAVTLKT